MDDETINEIMQEIEAENWANKEGQRIVIWFLLAFAIGMAIIAFAMGIGIIKY